ncbi:lipopolysaccharide biosynthesis protein [Bacteroidota bacterium]
MRSSFRIKFLQSEFVRNVLTILTGAAISQAIILLTSPVITRLFTPEEMGFFAIYMSVVSGIVVVVSGRYEIGIVLPKTNEEAYRLIILAFFICSAISLLSLLIIGLILILFPGISKWFLMVPLSVILLGLYNIFYNWSNRIKKYRKIAESRIVNAVVNVMVTIGAGFGKLGSAGLIIGNISGQVGGNISITEFKRLREETKKINCNSLKEVAKKYKDLPRKNSFQALFDMYQLNGLVYLIPVFFSQAIVGWYAFAMRILQAPVSLIGMAIAQVFYRKASEVYNQQGNL